MGNFWNILYQVEQISNLQLILNDFSHSSYIITTSYNELYICIVNVRFSLCYCCFDISELLFHDLQLFGEQIKCYYFYVSRYSNFTFPRNISILKSPCLQNHVFCVDTVKNVAGFQHNSTGFSLNLKWFPT